METDIHTKQLHNRYCDRELLERMKALPDTEMIPGDSEAASTLMAKAVAAGSHNPVVGGTAGNSGDDGLQSAINPRPNVKDAE